MTKHNVHLDIEGIFIAHSGAVAGCSISALLIDRILQACEDISPEQKLRATTKRPSNERILTGLNQQLSLCLAMLMRFWRESGSKAQPPAMPNFEEQQGLSSRST